MKTQTNHSSLPSFIHHSDTHSNGCAIVDRSTWPRCGFRGASAANFLKQAGLPVPTQPNHSAVTQSGELILRLSQSEFWILSHPQTPGDLIATITNMPLPEQQCYPLYNQHGHSWFILSGDHLCEMMAKLCGVDLRPENFPVGAIAQTSVARINCIIVHHQFNDGAAFSILSDCTFADYLWSALQDAMQEFIRD